MKKTPLLLLHDAVGSKKEFDPLIEKLKKKFNIHAIDLPGHGKSNIPEEPFSIALFAEAVIEWMDVKKMETIDKGIF